MNVFFFLPSATVREKGTKTVITVEIQTGHRFPQRIIITHIYDVLNSLTRRVKVLLFANSAYYVITVSTMLVI